MGTQDELNEKFFPKTLRRLLPTSVKTAADRLWSEYRQNNNNNYPPSEREIHDLGLAFAVDKMIEQDSTYKVGDIVYYPYSYRDEYNVGMVMWDSKNKKKYLEMSLEGKFYPFGEKFKKGNYNYEGTSTRTSDADLQKIFSETDYSNMLINIDDAMYNRLFNTKSGLWFHMLLRFGYRKEWFMLLDRALKEEFFH
eukprot:2904270-Pyramimonas_sp.AAC.1